jgi:hypothetical protein
MTDEELKALMRATRTEGYPCDLRQLVEAVQALEREACAQIGDGYDYGDRNCGDEIRARGNT